MISFAIVLFWVLVGSIAVQGFMTLAFVRSLRCFRTKLPTDGECPKVAAVLCLRGRDPFLGSCVRALLTQDYPCYDVRIIVDSRDDPAWREVERIVADSRWKKDRPNSAPQAPREATRHAERDEYESPSSVGPNLRVEPLAEHRQTCSLKCSSLAQAVASLDESYEVVALLDADTVPHRTWLRELVQPLADPGVGAATGNRWYMPAAITWATLVRYLWNAAAIVQMYCYGIPWGGTLALKLNVLRRTGLLQLWKHAFCEDTMLYKALGAEGLRVAFVPSLMMVNREACEMSGFISWLRRQLLTARLYHPGWPAVVLHGFATPLMLALGMILFAAALLRSDGPSAAWIGSGLACYLGLLPCLLALIESSVRRIVRARGEPTAWLSPSAAAMTFPAILLTQLVYPAGLASSMLLRTVEWRGVRYRVDGPWQIRLTEYHTHTGARLTSSALTSL